MFILLGIVVFIVIFIFIFNSIISAKNNVIETKSTIDTVLQNRYDLIPNIVEVVKQYVKHELDTLSKVTELRSSGLNQGTGISSAKVANENMITDALKSVFALAENYPDLKANTNFLNLQNQWQEIEDRIQAARRAYNSSVKILNNKKEQIPSNIVAGLMTIDKYEMFEASIEAKNDISAKELFNN